MLTQQKLVLVLVKTQFTQNMCNLSLYLNGLMDICERIGNVIVSSPYLPIFCVICFYFLPESLFFLVEITTLKLMNQYHEITSSYPTQISKIFHWIITFIIGINAWFYHLYDYLTLFIFIFLIIIAIWIFSLSNLYPLSKINKNQQQNENNQQNLNQSFNSFIDHHNISSQNVTNLMNITSESLPFEMNNQTLIFDDDIIDQMNNNINNNNNNNNNNIKNNMDEMLKLSEPTNFFQGLIGFSSVHSISNVLNIFNENEKMKIVKDMTKQNYFNLSSIHFSAMVIDLFSFILIPFFIFHIFLLYQSQHSLSFLCIYLFIYLFILALNQTNK